jgi:hypothetical protein
VLLAAQPELVTPVLQVVQRVFTRQLLGPVGLKANEGHGEAVRPIQRFGSAVNLNVHLHCLVLDGVYRCGADGAPAFIEAGPPTDDELQALLRTVIARLMELLKRVFDIDVQQCPNCGAAELKIIAAILERPLVEKILSHLGRIRSPRPRAGRARWGKTSPPEPRRGPLVLSLAEFV